MKNQMNNDCRRVIKGLNNSNKVTVNSNPSEAELTASNSLITLETPLLISRKNIILKDSDSDSNSGDKCPLLITKGSKTFHAEKIEYLLVLLLQQSINLSKTFLMLRKNSEQYNQLK